LAHCLAETVSVRLIFPALFNQRFEKLSQKVAALTPSPFVLGAIPPHISLFSFHYAGQPAISVRQSTVDSLGVCSLSANEAQCWIGVGIRETQKLITLRQEMITACGSPPLLRDGFLPHVTLGMISKIAYPSVADAIKNNDTLHAADIPCITDIVIHSPEKGYRPL